MIRWLCVGVMALPLAACVSTPAPQYQPSIDNTELLLQLNRRLAVGEFGAAAGVENHALSARGVQIRGGSDGTYATFIHDAVVSELQRAGSLDQSAPAQLTATLTRNTLNAGVATGSASVGADFTLERNGEVIYRQSLVEDHRWDSSFAGIVASSAAIDNYGATVQLLLKKLFSDPAFIAALASAAPAH